MAIDLLKKIWPEWQIGERIGGGSYGVAYEATRTDYNVESHAAIKMISIPANDSEIDSLRAEGLNMTETKTYLQQVVNDFVSEIQLMVSLEGCPNIVDVKDYRVVEKEGELGWHIFIRMELLTPFDAYMLNKKLSEKEVINLGIDICTALEICAEKNIIHRDVKPGNILVHKSTGSFKLGDFGIARKLENLAASLSQKGTYNYMAPEVVTGAVYDSRVDIYSLGIVLYRLMNGNRLPFLNESQNINPNEITAAVDRRIRGEALPAPCEASAAMADVILRACAHDPDKRFASAAEMKRALIMVANGTYKADCDSNLEKTTSVNKTPAVGENTISVRKVATGSNNTNLQSVPTFGANKTKNGKVYGLIAAISAAIFIFIVAAGVLIVPKLINMFDSGSTVGQYSDKDQIDDYISKAETLAANGDYEGALVKIEDGLLKYPNSEKLKAKKQKYENLLNQQTGQHGTNVGNTYDKISESSVISTGASSFLSQDKYNLAHTPERVIDNKLDTAWAEGAAGDGIGECLYMIFDDDYIVSGLNIYAGYHKSKDLYYKNGRPKEIEIEFADGTTLNCELYDVLKKQTIKFETPVITDEITIRILSVYNGTDYEDTIISEISLF